MLKSAGPAPEAKFTSLDLKSVDADGTFEGYASLFNREDLSRDVILPGAFRECLVRRGRRGIKLLFQHDPSQPLGVWESLEEDARGLFARGRLMPEIAKAREVLALMRAGAVDGLSIGFRPIKSRRDAKTGVRRLEKIDLWEISIVTFPMLPEARVLPAARFQRHAQRSPPFPVRRSTLREFERWLRSDARQSQFESRAQLRPGLERLAAARQSALGPTAEQRLAARMADAARLLTSNP